MDGRYCWYTLYKDTKYSDNYSLYTYIHSLALITVSAQTTYDTVKTCVAIITCDKDGLGAGEQE